MEIRLPSSVEKVIVVETDKSGRITPQTSYRKKKKRQRKSTIGLREAEMLLRRMAQAQEEFINSYLDEHNRSHRKKRDGWLFDTPRNLFRATEKGLKEMTKGI